MNHTVPVILQKFLKDKRPTTLGIVVFLILVAVALPVAVYANTANVRFEAESGSRSGAVSVQTDSSASNNEYLRFDQPATTPPPTQPNSCTNYSGTMNITSGGTYTGCWQAVTINTTAAVTLQNCGVRGPTNLISGGSGVNLTVRNCTFTGTKGIVTARTTDVQGRAVMLRNASSLVFENNYITDAGGIKVEDGSPTPIRIRYNSVKNIIGDDTNCCGGGFVQFVQIADVGNVPGIEIGWNQVINEFGKSTVEDNINFYNSGGTAASRARVHNNMIWGAFPLDLTSGYTGTGMIGVDAYDDQRHGFLDMNDNFVAGSWNSGVSLVCGSDIRVFNNKIINSNRTPSGQMYTGNSGNTGIPFWKHNNPCGPYENNEVFNNQVAQWSSNGGTCCKRNDFWFPGADIGTTNKQYNNVSLWPGQEIQYSREVDLFNEWLQKLSSNNIKVGPQ